MISDQTHFGMPCPNCRALGNKTYPCSNCTTGKAGIDYVPSATGRPTRNPRNRVSYERELSERLTRLEGVVEALKQSGSPEFNISQHPRRSDDEELSQQRRGLSDAPSTVQEESGVATTSVQATKPH